MLVQAECNGACSNCRGAAESRTLLGAKIQNLFDKYNTLPVPFIYLFTPWYPPRDTQSRGPSLLFTSVHIEQY